jgi:hypothetical protein
MIALAALLVLATAAFVASQRPPENPQFDGRQKREQPEPTQAEADRLRQEADEQRTKR